MCRRRQRRRNENEAPGFPPAGAATLVECVLCGGSPDVVCIWPGATKSHDVVYKLCYDCLDRHGLAVFERVEEKFAKDVRRLRAAKN